ncbi:hypothetical protein KP005_04960 [Geomonas nitrogeniifigens]|uniref:Uncharacterized protein n=1 Tax=Geomonas diazotrophica TaxID=2843197 RepID=A0ABX8JT98_9BACT|nr:hypothetical protein [Geomonas nitrogeniifigens]QWV98640.1 hypothetical protein KP005_04960 [Geomonas nitrogeniifigens]
MDKIEITAAEMAELKELRAQKAKAKEYARRQAVKNQIILEKAKKLNITASKNEIDVRIAALDATGEEEGADSSTEEV